MPRKLTDRQQRYIIVKHKTGDAAYAKHVAGMAPSSNPEASPYVKEALAELSNEIATMVLPLFAPTLAAIVQSKSSSDMAKIQALKLAHNVIVALDKSDELEGKDIATMTPAELNLIASRLHVHLNEVEDIVSDVFS